MKETRRQMEEREAQFEEKRKEEWAKLDEERRALTAEIAYEREKLEREKDMMQNIHSFQKVQSPHHTQQYATHTNALNH